MDGSRAAHYHRDLCRRCREVKTAHRRANVGVGMDLTRIDASQNVHRFYRIEVVPGLFGDWSLVREWGRIGQPGQVRDDWFDTEAAAKNARFDFLMKKMKRGYE